MELTPQCEVKKINLDAIRLDGGTQPRERIDMNVVREYADVLTAGAELPPLVVFDDGAEKWLADGFHRWHAHKLAGRASVSAAIHAGSLDDAKLNASGANATHGLRRTNEDKRRSVEMALAVPACREWSDTQLAKHCGVSVPFVGAIRRPAIAQRQQNNRAASASKQAAERNPITPAGRAEQSPATPAASKPTLDTRPADIPALTEADRLAEALDAIARLVSENEQLRDRLAVHTMEASEEEKLQASNTIKELREQVRTMAAAFEAVKSSRDTYMRESAELKKQVAFWRKQAETAAKEAA
jgi:hypothetical protein